MRHPCVEYDTKRCVNEERNCCREFLTGIVTHTKYKELQKQRYLIVFKAITIFLTIIKKLVQIRPEGLAENFERIKEYRRDLSQSSNSFTSLRRSTSFFAQGEIGPEGVFLALSRIKPAVSGSAYNRTYRTSPYNLTSAWRIRTLPDIETERRNHVLGEPALRQCVQGC